MISILPVFKGEICGIPVELDTGNMEVLEYLTNAKPDPQLEGKEPKEVIKILYEKKQEIEKLFGEELIKKAITRNHFDEYMQLIFDFGLFMANLPAVEIEKAKENMHSTLTQIKNKMDEKYNLDTEKAAKLNND